MSLKNHPVFSDYDRITSPYGWRTDPTDKTRTRREFHPGIDLVKQDKAPIYAFCGGKVVHARMGISGTGFGGYGNVVAIKVKHPNGAEHLHCYVHLDSIVVQVGQEVGRGQMIGRQGNTGVKTTGSHLHFEVRRTAHESPPFGWTENPELRCFEPEQYLIEFYELLKSEPTEVDELDLLEKRVEKLERLAKQSVPDWAREAVDEAVRLGIVDTPHGGSYDFYRLLTIIHRIGLLNIDNKIIEELAKGGYVKKGGN